MRYFDTPGGIYPNATYYLGYLLLDLEECRFRHLLFRASDPRMTAHLAFHQTAHEKSWHGYECPG